MESQNRVDTDRREPAPAAQQLLKHGMRSLAFRKTFTDPARFDQFLADLVAEYRPQTVSEEIYLERMAISLAKLSILEQAEVTLTGQTPTPTTMAVWQQENRLERTFDRAFDRLRMLQKERLAAQPKPQAPAVQPADLRATAPAREPAAGPQIVHRPVSGRHPEPSPLVINRTPLQDAS